MGYPTIAHKCIYCNRIFLRSPIETSTIIVCPYCHKPQPKIHRDPIKSRHRHQ